MKDIFTNEKVAEEIGIRLSLLEEDDSIEKDSMIAFEQICQIINKQANPKTLLKTIADYYITGLLSPLTLNNDEFIVEDDKLVNKRYIDIIKHEFNNKIVYNNAIAPKIVHVYNYDTKEEVPIFPNYIEYNSFMNMPIYISKGGASDGTFINEIYLKDSTVDKHCYIPHPPILVPVTLEIGDNMFRWSVDAREPKLKTIEEFYDIKFDKHDFKFDIRKYKKLNSYGKCKR